MRKKTFFSKFFIIFLVINFNNFSASIENKIIANVDNQIISTYELKNKIKTILFLSKQQLSQDNINYTKGQSLRTLVDYKLKLAEINKFQIAIDSTVDISDFLNSVASKYNTNAKGLEKLFNDNKIDFEKYTKEVKVDLAWNKLIFQKYKKKIDLNEKEVDKELNKIIKDQQELEQYKLSEIEILSENKKIDEVRINETINQIKEIGFNDAAVKFSNSPTAFEGGDLGWVSSKSLSKDVYNSIKILKIGDVSKPIFQRNNIIFLKLNDKKKLIINDTNVVQIRNKIINRKKNEILNLYSNNYLSKLKNKALIEIKYE
jgi:peptidyl-prolyl cis-trans isomerase SurA